MGKYRICVYAITKNEEKFVDRWMDSMEEADLIIVTDTGSTDRTVEKLRARGAIVYEEIIEPWRFDKARNCSLAHVPDNIDIAVCTDLDEVLRKGWRKHLEKAWLPDATMGNYLYNWSLNADGTPNTQFIYFKVHIKSCYKWSCPVHEFLEFVINKDFAQEKKVFIDGMILDHYPDIIKSRSSYLPLLEMGVEEAPFDDRMRYYLGREYMYLHRWNDCITTLRHHLILPSASWAEERSASMRWIAKSYHQLGNIKEAYEWYYKAIAEVPGMRDPYIECAKMAYLLKDWVTVIYMTETALQIKEKSKVYVNMGYSWDYTPNDLSAIAHYWLGNYETSLHHATLALDYDKDDARLKNNYNLIYQKLKQQG